MTPDQMRDALRYLGWSQAELARRVRVDPNTVSKWAQEKAPIPGTVAAYLDLAVKVKTLGKELG
jgi:ribosome-binding protein aMBF1 (putative translation factor)